MEAFKGLVDRIITEEDGQGMVEYALIAALVAVVIIAVVGQLQGGFDTAFGNIVDALTGTDGAGGGAG